MLVIWWEKGRRKASVPSIGKKCLATTSFSCKRAFMLAARSLKGTCRRARLQLQAQQTSVPAHQDHWACTEIQYDEEGWLLWISEESRKQNGPRIKITAPARAWTKDLCTLMVPSRVAKIFNCRSASSAPFIELWWCSECQDQCDTTTKAAGRSWTLQLLCCCHQLSSSQLWRIHWAGRQRASWLSTVKMKKGDWLKEAYVFDISMRSKDLGAYHNNRSRQTYDRHSSSGTIHNWTNHSRKKIKAFTFDISQEEAWSEKSELHPGRRRMSKIIGDQNAMNGAN